MDESHGELRGLAPSGAGEKVAQVKTGAGEKWRR